MSIRIELRCEVCDGIEYIPAITRIPVGWVVHSKNKHTCCRSCTEHYDRLRTERGSKDDY